MNVALAVIAAFLILAVTLALLARRGRDMDLEQWSVGGRGFGAIFVFLLMAGEIYSTFTFLGGAGLVYGSGGAAYYILGYGTLAYILSYWLLPAVWRYATPRKLLSQSDFFVSKYDSRALGVLVSLVTVAAMIPYLALQLKGLGIIVSQTSSGSISSTAAVWIGAFVLSVYVVASGIHGSAWTAAIKDVLTLSVVVFIGLYLPIHYFGSIGEMFHRVQDAKPGFAALSDEQLTPGVVLLHGAADRARLLHVAAHVRLVAGRARRERVPPQRDLHAALPAADRVRAAGRVRRRAAAAGAGRGLERPGAARRGQAGVPGVVRRADRRGGHALRAGPGLDAADRLGDDDRPQRLPRREPGGLGRDRDQR